jgi:hypothetical protein
MMTPARERRSDESGAERCMSACDRLQEYFKLEVIASRLNLDLDGATVRLHRAVSDGRGADGCVPRHALKFRCAAGVQEEQGSDVAAS